MSDVFRSLYTSYRFAQSSFRSTRSTLTGKALKTEKYRVNDVFTISTNATTKSNSSILHINSLLHALEITIFPYFVATYNLCAVKELRRIPITTPFFVEQRILDVSLDSFVMDKSFQSLSAPYRGTRFARKS